MDNEKLKVRVKGQVHFVYLTEGALWYKCDDNFVFPIPLADTGNAQGGSATFLRDDKGMMMMRWIRKEMEVQYKAAQEKGSA